MKLNTARLSLGHSILQMDRGAKHSFPGQHKNIRNPSEIIQIYVLEGQERRVWRFALGITKDDI